MAASQADMNELYNACGYRPVDIKHIRLLLEKKGYSPDQLAEVFIKHLEERCEFEVQEFNWSNDRTPQKDEVYSGSILILVEIFLEYGMNPNYIKGDNSILLSLKYVAFKNLCADTARLILERGGDPNLVVNGESVFEQLDFDIIFDAREFFSGEEYIPPENAHVFNALVHLWFVMMGYGGVIKGGRCPVSLKEGCSVEMLKQHERLDFSVSLNRDAYQGWELLIFEKESGETIAWV